MVTSSNNPCFCIVFLYVVYSIFGNIFRAITDIISFLPIIFFKSIQSYEKIVMYNTVKFILVAANIWRTIISKLVFYICVTVWKSNNSTLFSNIVLRKFQASRMNSQTKRNAAVWENYAVTIGKFFAIANDIFI
jgi:hypothetical protein